MKENQGAEQTLHSLLPDQLDSSTLAKCSLGDKEKLLRGLQNTQAKKIHHQSYSSSVNVKIKMENSVTVHNGRKSNADNFICKVN